MARHRTKKATSIDLSIATIAALPLEKFSRFATIPGIGLYPVGRECPHCAAQQKKLEELSKNK